MRCVGRQFVVARRIGKLLLLDMDDGGVLGLRFGMTGRLVLDDRAGVDDLQYASSRRDAAWDRFIVHFDDGGSLRINDARRLGGVELDPDEARLGADAASITPGQLTAALDHSTAPLKARLMDQHRVAGLGNLLVDEVLWRAGLDPARPAGSLDSVERRRLHRHLRRTVDDLLTIGGSHLGRLQVGAGSRWPLPEGRRRARAPNGRRPHDLLMSRSTSGSRRTVRSCTRSRRWPSSKRCSPICSRPSTTTTGPDRLDVTDGRSPTSSLHLAQTNEMAIGSAQGRFTDALAILTEGVEAAGNVDDGADLMVRHERGVPVTALLDRWQRSADTLVGALHERRIRTSESTGWRDSCRSAP